MRFYIYADNAGTYHWRLIDAAGETLATSGSFASADDARGAASAVREGAGSAPGLDVS
jgi:uncharacterized protein YegP (UPF0339 family)